MVPFDVVPYAFLGASVLAAAWHIAAHRRRGADWAPAIAGGWGIFLGMNVLALAGLHTLTVAGGALARALGFRPGGVDYDFRLYSLLLLGVLLVTIAYGIIARAGGVARSDRAAWRASFTRTSLLLAIVLPLLPLQPGFAIGFTAFGAVQLALLAASRPQRAIGRSALGPSIQATEPPEPERLLHP